jgi:hypothetical protein
MAYHQMHLIRSGSGMATKSACGRNVLRLPLATNWEGFKATPEFNRCEKCAASKQAELNTRRDAEKEPAFEPVSPEEAARIEAEELAMVRAAAPTALHRFFAA